MIGFPVPDEYIFVPFLDAMGYSRWQVRELFDRIAFRYDFLNRLLSLGIDRSWRSRLIRSCDDLDATRTLDLATGTGDVLVETSRLRSRLRVGLDVSRAMLRRAQTKLDHEGVSLIEGAAEYLPFKDKSFDLILVSFGVRNFSSRPDGLSEMRRILRPGGQIRVLDFSRPEGAFRHLYQPYFRSVLPAVGGIISGSRDAYQYLPDTVMDFPSPEEFRDELVAAGFHAVAWTRMSQGIVTLFSATT